MGARSLKLAVFATVLFVSVGAWGAPYHVNDLPRSLERKVRAVTTMLEHRGYEVARGYWKTFGIDDCPWAIDVIGNCLGNNPRALATATGNATYVSMSVNRQAVLQGVKNLSQRDLTQSAAGFGVPRADELYAFYLARRCPTGKKAPCFEIPETDVPANEVINLIQRNYIKPGTARGADPGEAGDETLLRPRLIWLDPADCPP